MMRHHYKSNLRDIFFNIFELHQIGTETFGHGRFAHLDEETMRDALVQLEKICTQELATSFAESDRVGLKFDGEGNVALPEALKKSLDVYFESGWHLLELPEHLGGFGAPPSVIWAQFEMLAGSNPSVPFYLFGGFMSKVIDSLGTPEQKEMFCNAIVDRRWGGSMVLTEPDAGSDVGAAVTKAKDLGDGTWAIEGVKRFITNGDYDYTENIIHLVLARPEGAQAGTKGLSLFIVPKFWVNEDGSLGERNGAWVTNIEKKMGLHASSTCEITFGDRGVCRGLLMGNVHDGIRQMFRVIEHARMAVGMKSMATLSTGYLNALEYTKERVQGPDLARANEKDSPRVRIITHPDVRRMLMSQKAHAEGMRALAFYTAVIQDKVELLGGHESKEARAMDRRNDFLLPLVKGYCSEKGYEQLAISLQCFGGSGYCQDYPIEQYLRDAKIDTLYEGTTHIQSLDLFFRKVARDMGETLMSLMSEINDTVESLDGNDALALERDALKRAHMEVGSIYQTMLGKLQESVYHVGLQGNRILESTAELVIAWLLVRQAQLAEQKLPNAVGSDRNFYTGKMASARFFCQNVLPQITLRRKLIENSDLALLDVPEEAF
jgi:alkylation response protein AidB-like acyl-CoA dehydrogenase